MGSQIVKEKLHRAIGKDDKKTVKSILDNFPSLLDEQLTTDSRMTPLLKATKNRNIDMVLMLLEMGAIPDRANDNGITPLMMAAIRDDV
jgi:ankyrin repeat protein